MTPSNIQLCQDFLRAIFRTNFQQAWVCNYPNWGGGFAPNILESFDDSKASYYSCATQSVNSTSRDDESFEAAHVYVVDDVGTKIPRQLLDGFAPEPSFIVETSNGNFQYGYILTEPVYDDKLWSAFIDGFKKSATWKGGGDHSGLGAYYRLPIGKSYKNGFQTRLIALHSDLTYAIEDLAEAFEIDISPAAVAQAKGRKTRRTHDYVAGAEIDDIGYQTLDHLNWVLGAPDANGRIPIRCPWEDQHTSPSENITATVYQPRGPEGIPDFKCLHAHCDGRRWRGNGDPDKGLFEFLLRHEVGGPFIRARLFPEVTEEEKEKIEAQAKVAEDVVEVNLLSTLRSLLPDYARSYGASIKFDCRTYDDDARQSKPLVRPRILSGFQRDIMSLIAAKPGAGKSALMVNLALAVAYERPDLIGRKWETMDFTGDVVIIANEDSHDEVKTRLQGAEQRFDLKSADEKSRVHIIANSNISLLKKTREHGLRPACRSLVERLIRIAETREIAMIIIDTLSSAITGINENDNGEMQAVADFIRQFASAAFASTVIVHHVSKGGAQAEEADMYSARGASSLVGAVRSSLQLSGPTKTDLEEYGWSKEQARSIVRVDSVKANYAATHGLRAYAWFRWTTVDIPSFDPRDPSKEVQQGVGVLEPFEPVAISSDPEEIKRLVELIRVACQEYGYVKVNNRSSNMPGLTLAEVLDLPESAAKKRLDDLLRLRLVNKTVKFKKNFKAEVVQIADDNSSDDDEF